MPPHPQALALYHKQQKHEHDGASSQGAANGIYGAINYFLLIKSKLNASRGRVSLLKTIKRTARLCK